MNTSTLVQKLWNCCNVLRDDVRLFDCRHHTLEVPAGEEGKAAPVIGKAFVA